MNTVKISIKICMTVIFRVVTKTKTGRTLSPYPRAIILPLCAVSSPPACQSESRVNLIRESPTSLPLLSSVDKFLVLRFTDFEG